jgi:hypothetical protein
MFSFQGCGSVYGVAGSAYRLEVKDNVFWKVVTVCGYEPCQPVAALKGKDGYIRIKPSIGTREENVLTVEFTFVEFEDGLYEFDPSLTFATFNGNKIVNAKGLRCNTIPHQIHHFKDALIKAPEISGRQQLNKKFDCYVSFFDIENSTLDKTFNIKINGLIKNGQQVNIPEIYFYK